MAYCAICLYPAPCGRDHGEDADGNPIHATTGPIGEVFCSDAFGWVSPMDVDGWRCPHHGQVYHLQDALGHILIAHDDCSSCNLEKLVVAGIIDFQTRKNEGIHLVSEDR